MPKRWMFVAAVWLCFQVYTLTVVRAGGLLGFLGVPAAHPWGLQVILDLFIALFVALAYVAPKARKLGVPRLPYALATCALGSIGLLAYVAHVEWAEERERERSARS